MGDRLRSLRYLASDLLYVIARVPRAIASGVARFWRSLPIITRRRLVAAAGAIAVVLVFAGLVVPSLPCALPGGDECAPDDDAIGLAPAGSLAYMHVNLDPETEQAERAAEIAARMPLVARQVIGQTLAQVGAGAPLAAASEPWFGGEAAVVVAGGGAEPERVQLLETTDAERAQRYAESITSGVPETSSYRDVEISEDGQGLASAVVDDFLLLGASQGVRAVIDVATGADGAQSLADDSVATRALDELPEHRFAEAYLSADGIKAFVASPRGELSTFAPLVDSTASRGAALALSAEEDGLSLATRSVLDPDRSDAEPGFFAAFEDFNPELPDELQPDALAYVGLGEASETIAGLVRQATVRAPGIAAGFTDLIENLRGDSDVDLQGDLLEALGGEAAFAVVPREAVDPEADAVPSASTLTPYLELLADDVDEDRAREALARLQGPIARSLDSGARRTGVRPAPLRRPAGGGAPRVAGRADPLRHAGLEAPGRQRRGGRGVAGRGGRRRVGGLRPLSRDGGRPSRRARPARLSGPARPAGLRRAQRPCRGHGVLDVRAGPAGAWAASGSR